MLNASLPPPDDVIRALREIDGYLRLILMNGGCWRFNRLLSVIFPEAEVFKVALSVPGDFDHIVTKIDGKFYDITGEVHKTDFPSFAPVEAEDVHEFERWSFSRTRLLFKRCPHCGEEIAIKTNGEVEGFR